MNNDILNLFIGKKVKIRMLDNYVKFGILKDADSLFYYLMYSDGSVIGINKKTVKQISLDVVGIRTGKDITIDNKDNVVD